MKIQVTFKTPDAVDFAVEQSISAEDSESREAARRAISSYVRYGETVTIEFDIDAGTATVMKV